jgi:hypothetical protein
MIRTAAVFIASAALAAACSTTLLLNNDNLQTEIATWVQQNYGVSATVSCPDDRPIKQGDVFQCQATTSDGQNVVFEVTQTDNTGHVNFKIVSAS